jgi:hypothetical protein
MLILCSHSFPYISHRVPGVLVRTSAILCVHLPRLYTGGQNGEGAAMVHPDTEGPVYCEQFHVPDLTRPLITVDKERENGI